MIDANHPFYFLKPLFQKRDTVFEFSKYVYLADTLRDEREVISIAGDRITIEWLNTTLNTLRHDQELAIHSIVKINGKSFHIPLIDFSLRSDPSVDVYLRMKNFLPKNLFQTMAIFSSGRSFHGYSLTLLSPKNWHDFMGRLLLINPKDTADIIDSRWIGHRLIGGHGSLRWSNNSGTYLATPSRIEFPLGQHR